jgi:hypothetical protein
LCSLGAENPTSQPRVQNGFFPLHFIAGKSKLYVGLISGDKLRSVQAIGKQDPYCEVYLSRSRQFSSSDLIYTSKTHDNGGEKSALHFTLDMLEALTIGGGGYRLQARTRGGWKASRFQCRASSTTT